MAGYATVLAVLVRPARPTRYRKAPTVRAAVVPPLCFVLYVFVRALLSPDVVVAMVGFATYGMYACFYLLLVWSFSTTSVRRLLSAMLVAAVAVGILGLAQLAVPAMARLLGQPMPLLIRGPGGIHVVRVTSSFGSPLYYGAYLALVLPVLLMVWSGTVGALRRLSCFLGVLILAANLLLTFTRAAWLQVALSLGLMLAWSLAGRSSSARTFRRLSVALAAAVGIAVVAFLCFQPAREWSSLVIQRAASTSNLQSEAGNVLRVSAWSNSLAQIGSPQSLLFGIGPGLTMVRADRYVEEGLSGTESLLLQTLVELGAVGLILFVLAFLTIVRFGMTAIRHPTSGSGDHTTLGALAAVVGLVPNLVFTTAFNSWEVSCTFWLLSAFLVVSARQQRALLLVR
jgi:O-antigen ligase